MGEIAALVTALCWAFSSLFFSHASGSIGSTNLNRIRLVLAVIFISLTNLVLTGQLIPLQATPTSWFWLGLSGIIGLVIGDSMLYESYVLIGVRLATLVMASAPVISTLIAWIFLAEKLSTGKLAGILIAVAGIGIVVMEGHQNNGNPHDNRKYVLGLLSGLGGATCQAAGLVLAKEGLTPDLPSSSGVVIRMLTAMVVIWAIALLTGKGKQTFEKVFVDKKVALSILGGSIVGPFIGVWLSIVAIRATYVGIASTLMALSPIILLPILQWGYKEEVSSRAVAGTLLAMAGVATIFLVP